MSKAGIHRRISIWAILAAAFGLFGAFCTWSRWTWTPTGIPHAPMSVGLFHFEGWLVFLLLGFVAICSVTPLRKIPGLQICMVVAGIGALISCLVFMWRTSFHEAANAVWFSLVSSALVITGSLILSVRDRKAGHILDF